MAVSTNTFPNKHLQKPTTAPQNNNKHNKKKARTSTPPPPKTSLAVSSHFNPFYRNACWFPFRKRPRNWIFPLVVVILSTYRVIVGIYPFTLWKARKTHHPLPVEGYLSWGDWWFLGVTNPKKVWIYKEKIDLGCEKHQELMDLGSLRSITVMKFF